MRRMVLRAVIVIGFAVLGPVAAGFAQGTVTAMSLADPALISNTGNAGSSTFPPSSVSSDGRYLAFVSSASNLIEGQIDTAGSDVFLYDRVLGTTILVSHASGSLTTTGNSSSAAPVISGDGAYVAFTSSATNLGFTDGNGTNDVILFTRATGDLSLVSHTSAALTTTGNGISYGPVISDDGDYVVFQSGATNLGFTDGNGTHDVFLFERATGALSLVSHTGASLITTANNLSDSPVISGDGAYVAFSSRATNLGFTEGNTFYDVILFTRATGVLSLVSHASGLLTTTGNGSTGIFGSTAVISGDGAYVAFTTSATDLGFTDSNGNLDDIVLFNRVTGALSLVSHADGLLTTTANSYSATPVISSDGAYVAFTSSATNLGFTDSNGTLDDVVLFTRATGALTLVSHTGADLATAGNDSSSSGYKPVISGDGAYVAFRSRASDLGFTDGNGTGEDIVVFARSSGTLSLVSHTGASLTTTGNDFSESPVISGDGAYVAFTSSASDLLAGGGADANATTDVFLFEQSTGNNELVSVRVDASLVGNGASAVTNLLHTSISADGRHVAFVSAATNLFAGQVDTNGTTDVFLYDRELGTSTLVSHTAASLTTAANGAANDPVISADGAYVVFRTGATNHGFTDGNSTEDLVLFSRATGALTLVSRSGTSATTTANGTGETPSISGDGSYVAFKSFATNHGFTEGNASWDVFLFTRATGSLTLVSRTSANANTTGNDLSFCSPVISRDGAYVAFHSEASNLGFTDTNNVDDVFLFSRATGLLTLASRTSLSATAAGNQISDGAVISGDGAFVAFTSRATNLGFTDGNSNTDVILFDRAAGTLSLVSHTATVPFTTTGNGASESPVISTDGAYLAFSSRALNLGFTDASSLSDVVLYARATGVLSLVSHTGASPTTTGNHFSDLPVISSDGGYVAFRSVATDLGFTDANGASDAILFKRSTGALSLVSHHSGSLTSTANGSSNGPVISDNGAHVAFTSNATNLVAGDLNGFSDAFLFTDEAGRFRSLPPCRLLDTRLSASTPPPLGGPLLASGAIRTFVVAGLCGVPADARALSINATVTQASGAGELVLFRADLGAAPSTNNVAFTAGRDRANNGVVELALDGSVAFAARALVAGDGTVHLIVDVNGYFR